MRDFCPECITLKSDSKVTAKAEHGVRAIFNNPEKQRFVVIQIDECEVRQQVAADFLVQQEGVGQVIVECKGKNTKHACEQIKATLDYILPKTIYTKKQTAALIVTSQSPKITGQKQIFINEMRKDKNIKLHIEKSPYYCDLVALL